MVAGRGDLRVLVIDVGLFNAFSFNGDVADAERGETADVPFVNFDLTVKVVGFGAALN